MIIRPLIALLFALGMVAGGALAQGSTTDAPGAFATAAEPTDPEATDPVEPETAEEPPVVFPVEDILGTLTRNDQLIEFHSALLAANVDLMFDPDQEYTVFAPMQDAFVEQAHDALRTQSALAYYIVPGSYSYDDLWNMAQGADDGVATLTTLEDHELTVEVIDDQLFVGGVALITQPDIPAQNGFVHVIDTILQPTGTIDIGG